MTPKQFFYKYPISQKFIAERAYLNYGTFRHWLKGKRVVMNKENKRLMQIAIRELGEKLSKIEIT